MDGAEQPAGASGGANGSDTPAKGGGRLGWGVLLIGSGALITLLFGALSAFFAISFLDQFQMEGQISVDMLGFSLLVAFAPFLFGLLLIIIGVRMVRKRR